MKPSQSMILKDVVRDVPHLKWYGSDTINVGSVVYDTRKLKEGDLFCTWSGEQTDGHEYLSDAVRKGACALVVENEPNRLPDCPVVVVESGRSALSLLAANRWGNPANDLKLTGITGTNGKSSTATLLHYLLESSEFPCGLIGTIEYRLGDRVEPAERTTPEGSDTQEMLATMREAGCRGAVMEVSSHALDQGRVSGIAYQGAIFTNLSPDHLDYHKNMDAYFSAKCVLFEQITPGGFAVLPKNSQYTPAIEQRIDKTIEILHYGVTPEALSQAIDIQYFRSGTSFVWKIRDEEHEVMAPWIGSYNLENILAAMTAAVGYGIEPAHIASLMEKAPPVPGRLERVDVDERFTVLVDYAHTEDALRNVLRALQPLKERRLKTLIGCGGNRDRTKRPKMAQVACEFSDEVIFTSDNPRDEEPELILQEMVDGVTDHKNHSVIVDRKEAIRAILESAAKGDIILVAGKGHERTQEVRGTKHPFSDVEVVIEVLKGQQR
ncbi:MAG: UDP-N-acetylmuramoyl-L-alanyl-D-glutamate--2,6-diaminopimelate ligase [Verrucomicrobiota bacterium]